MTDYFFPIATEKPSVTVSNYKRNPAIEARIEKIGKADDEAKAARENGDALELLRIAERYETEFNHMKKTARSLRLEAAEMRAKA